MVTARTATMQPQSTTLLDGVKLTQRQLYVSSIPAPQRLFAGRCRRLWAELLLCSLATFERHGVRRIDALGAKFDPRVHEAVYTLVTALGLQCWRACTAFGCLDCSLHRRGSQRQSISRFGS